jgi:hypothetical protein
MDRARAGECGDELAEAAVAREGSRGGELAAEVDDDGNEAVCCREYANNGDQCQGDAAHLDEDRSDDDEFRGCGANEDDDPGGGDGRNANCGQIVEVNGERDRDDLDDEKSDDDCDDRRRHQRELENWSGNFLRRSML